MRIAPDPLPVSLLLNGAILAMSAKNTGLKAISSVSLMPLIGISCSTLGYSPGIRRILLTVISWQVMVTTSSNILSFTWVADLYPLALWFFIAALNCLAAFISVSAGSSKSLPLRIPSASIKHDRSTIASR